MINFVIDLGIDNLSLAWPEIQVKRENERGLRK